MKSTGIVRRIDDLGRVVIPKEIRRTSRIRENDPLEIFIGNNGEIIFKKYSDVGNLEQFAQDYVRALHDVSGYTALVCDRTKVIAAAGPLKKSCLGKNITAQLFEESAYYKTNVSGKSLKPVEGLEVSAITAASIVDNNDMTGSIVLLAKDENSIAGEAEMKMVLTAVSFIKSQLSDY